MSLDIRPHVTFYTSPGAVIVAVDPASVLGGSLIIPGVGAVPYDIDLLNLRMILHVPGYGNAPISLNPSGGGGSSTVTIPGLGIVPYAVTIGPPDIPLEQQFSLTGSLLTGTSAVMPWVLFGLAAFLFFRPRRNPRRHRHNPLCGCV